MSDHKAPGHADRRNSDARGEGRTLVRAAVVHRRGDGARRVVVFDPPG